MKGFIGFLGLLAFLGLAYVAQNYLKQSVQDQEIIEWSNSLVWAAIGSQSSVEFMEPEVVPSEQPDLWTVSGQIALRQGNDGTAVHPYTSRIAKICEAADSFACWRLERLMIGGSEVDLTDFASEDIARNQATGSASTETAAPAELAEGTDAVTSAPDDDGTTSGEGEAASPESADTGQQREEQLPAAAETAASTAAPTASDAQADVAAAAPSSEKAAATAETASPATTASSSSPTRQQLISQIQARLQDLGYSPGPIDGLMGPQTRSAIESYQRSHDFPVDGRPSASLLEHLSGQSR